MNSAKEIGGECTEEVPFKLVLDFEQKFTRQKRKERVGNSLCKYRDE